MSALEPLGKSLGTVIDERLSSPLISTFAISWCLWNYKFFVILFSDTSVTLTFELIERLYPTWKEVLGWGVVAPFASTLVYIYGLPYLSQPVYERWRIAQRDTERIRNRYPSEGLLSPEQSWEVKKENLELESQLNQEKTLVRTLQGDLNVATEKINVLEQNEYLAVEGQHALETANKQLKLDLESASLVQAQLTEVNQSAVERLSKAHAQLRQFDALTENNRSELEKAEKEIRSLQEAAKNYINQIAQLTTERNSRLLKNLPSTKPTANALADLLIPSKIRHQQKSNDLLNILKKPSLESTEADDWMFNLAVDQLKVAKRIDAGYLSGERMPQYLLLNALQAGLTIPQEFSGVELRTLASLPADRAISTDEVLKWARANNLGESSGDPLRLLVREELVTHSVDGKRVSITDKGRSLLEVAKSIDSIYTSIANKIDTDV